MSNRNDSFSIRINGQNFRYLKYIVTAEKPCIYSYDLARKGVLIM